MSEDIKPNNEIDLEALVTKMQSLETMLLLTRTELKTTQIELQQSQEYVNRTLVGSVSAFAMPDVPEGWLICDGKAVSRTVYSRLFQAINTIYGKGNSSTTFNLPDMRGLFIRGHDPVGKNDSQRKFASYQEDQIQSHGHTDSGHSHSGSTGSEGNHSHSASTGEAGSHSHNGSTSSEDGHPHKFFDLSSSTCFLNGLTLKRSSSYESQFSIPYVSAIDYNYRTVTYGSHNHKFSTELAEPHTHCVNFSSAGSHTHSVSINSDKANLSNPTNARHGSETRVKNLALIYCIKY